MRPPQIRLVLLLILLLLAVTAVANVVKFQHDRTTLIGTGSSGLRVTAAQWLLNAAEIEAQVTGTYARQTASAVKGFQTRSGLEATGKLDDETFAKLTPMTRPGERGFRVRAVQTLLNLHNHKTGVYDDFDGATRDQVVAFQKEEGLEASGIVDRKTWTALNEGPTTGPVVSEADQFVETLAPYARDIRQQFGVPASIALAQAAQETGWGRSAPGNNYYGVKCHDDLSSAGPIAFRCENRATTEFVNGQKVNVSEPFRSYASMRDSVIDYAHFLRTRPRYQPAFAVNGNADAFARELQRAGYATDPAYADSLIAIMQRNNLYQYDN